jgi:hypothetical protein
MMQKTRLHVLMSPCVLPSGCLTSLACPLLAARGWEQFKNDILKHEDTPQDEVSARLR